MIYYIQVDNNGMIRDAITYPHEGYIPYEVPGPLPIGFLGGWFKFENGVHVEIVELNPNTIANQVKVAIDNYTLELIEGGLL